jgi:hypothetical protein
MSPRLVRTWGARRGRSFPNVEGLEDRRLLSVAVDNATLVFSNAKATGNPPSAPRLVTLTNTGSSSIDFSSAIISGDTTDFAISSEPAANTVIAPGGTAAVGITFTAPSSTSAVTLHTATLSINTTDAANPTVNVNLRALALTGYQGGPEPSLAQVVDTLYQIPVNIGFPLTTLTLPYELNGVDTVSYGSEDVTQLFQKASSGPVTVKPLATFGPAASVPYTGADYTWGYYTPGNSSATTAVYSATTPLGSPSGGDGQTVNPIAHPASPNTVSTDGDNTVTFDPGANPFGIYTFFPVTSPNITDYSQDYLNAATPIGTNEFRRIRFWEALNPNGTVIPNTFVAGEEEATNNDLQDIVFEVSNVNIYTRPTTTDFQNFNGTAGSTLSSFNFTPTLGGFTYTNTGGALDQGTSTGGGAVTTSAADSTAVYTGGTTPLADGNVHTVSMMVKDSDTNTSDTPLQLGWLAASNQTFDGTETVNGNTIKPSFISARILGDSQLNLQSANAGTTASATTVNFTSAATTGDWLQLTVSAQETNTSTGAFTVTYSVTDFGPNGNAPGKVLLAPATITETSAGIANIVGYAGFHSSGTGYTSDDFSLDPTNAIPAPPTLNSAMPVTSSIALSWSGVSGADSYTVLRGTASGSETALAVNLASTSFTDTTAVSNTQYFYTVEAFGGVNSSIASNELSAIIVPPTILSVTPQDAAGNGVAAGSAAKGQRSMETQIQVVFNEPVNLSSGAFALALVNNYGSGANNGSPDTSLSGVLGTPANPSGDGETWIIPVLSNGTNSYALKGTHGGISGASLENGVYQLSVVASDVTAATGGTVMTANYTSAAWHRLYGDVDNAQRVFNTEYSALLAAFASTYLSNGATNYNEDLDYDGDGRVFNTDYGAFLADFGSTKIYSEPQS